MARHDFALCGRSKPPSSADGSAVKECTRAQPSESVVGCGGQVSGHRQRRGRHRGARALTCQGTSHGDEVRSEAGRVRSVRPQTSGAGEWATGTAGPLNPIGAGGRHGLARGGSKRRIATSDQHTPTCVRRQRVTATGD